MDDVFEESDSSGINEIVVGARDWSKRVEAAKLLGERDGICDGREIQSQQHFEAGVINGFKLVAKAATIRGRLLVHAQLSQPGTASHLNGLIKNLQESEKEIVVTYLKGNQALDSEEFHRITQHLESLINSARSVLNDKSEGL
ncbi:unnamed protein product [Calicophoron daubneyi]|uniref:Uncharacterized protein n=1 Tax=Calicophoron daubneyi TaxID=300641 RepID=A0AAV2THF7_CALDB